MKKLMILAAVAMAAVCSQAANVQWNSANVYKYTAPTSSTKAGAETMAWFVYSSDYKYTDAVADLAKGDIAFLGDYGQASKAYNNGMAGNTVTTLAGKGETFKGYLVILDNTDMAKATHAYLTTELTKTTSQAGGAAQFLWTSLGATATADNWSAVNVPEPTSGLLLLLGVAGLALKRKQK